MRTEAWELSFNSQFKDMMSITKEIEKAITRLDQRMSNSTKERDKVLTEIAQDVTEDFLSEDGLSSLQTSQKSTASMTQAIRHLMESGRKVSLREIGNKVVEALRQGNETTPIREALIELLWQKDWVLDTGKEKALAVQSHPDEENLRSLTETIIQDLRFEAFDDREESIPTKYDNTFKWILQENPVCNEGEPLWNSFPHWLKSDTESTYWITGKPGSGKSTMMKYIVRSEVVNNYLQEWSGSTPLIILQYHAWQAGFSMQKSWKGLQRTILFQALHLNPDLTRTIAPRRWTFARVCMGAPKFPQWPDWEVEESFELLMGVCGKATKIALFIDGLDEFESPPSSVVQLIDGLSKVEKNSLKVCVASRPWTEFDDAYHGRPSLQMHLLTRDDLSTFVNGRLNSSRGFRELQHIYPKESSELAEGVVTKAEGVFLWVSLVVQSLLELLSEGSRLTDLQEKINDLPSDISSLYDAIWKSIPEQSVNDASWMLQLILSAQGPIQWLTLWIADESKLTRVNIENLDATARTYAAHSLRRRLATRTRGILELTHGTRHFGGFVGFCHRTARDWALQPEVWDRIHSRTSRTDIFLSLLEAETLVMSDPSHATEFSLDSLWEKIYKILWYASQVEDSPQSVAKLVELLDFFDAEASKAYKMAQNNWPTVWKIQATQHWSIKQDYGEKRRGLINTFLGITAQFAILPYVQTKLLSQNGKPKQRESEQSLGLLENAIFGYRYFTKDDYRPETDLPPISAQSRVATVNFLLKYGIKQTKVHAANGWVPLLGEVRERQTGTDEDRLYFEQIEGCLQKKNTKSRLSLLLVHLGFSQAIHVWPSHSSGRN